MPRAAKLTILVNASVENLEPMMMTAGTAAATISAYGGTWRDGENFASSRLPKIMLSRP